jgi:hypothetical protein
MSFYKPPRPKKPQDPNVIDFSTEKNLISRPDTGRMEFVPEGYSRFGIDYNRAKELVDQAEKMGINPDDLVWFMTVHDPNRGKKK